MAFVKKTKNILKRIETYKILNAFTPCQNFNPDKYCNRLWRKMDFLRVFSGFYQRGIRIPRIWYVFQRIRIRFTWIGKTTDISFYPQPCRTNGMLWKFYWDKQTALLSMYLSKMSSTVRILICRYHTALNLDTRLYNDNTTNNYVVIQNVSSFIAHTF